MLLFVLIAEGQRSLHATTFSITACLSPAASTQSQFCWINLWHHLSIFTLICPVFSSQQLLFPIISLHKFLARITQPKYWSFRYCTVFVNKQRILVVVVCYLYIYLDISYIYYFFLLPWLWWIKIKDSRRYDAVCTQNAHWSDVISENASNSDVILASERRRRDAVWELFTSECVFLLDHLLALKHVNDLPIVDRFFDDVVHKVTARILFIIYDVSQTMFYVWISTQQSSLLVRLFCLKCRLNSGRNSRWVMAQSDAWTLFHARVNGYTGRADIKRAVSRAVVSNWVLAT